MTDPMMRGDIFQARRNVFQPRRIKIQARDNEIQAGRNEIKMAFPSAIRAFSKVYADASRLSPFVVDPAFGPRPADGHSHSTDSVFRKENSAQEFFRKVRASRTKTARHGRSRDSGSE